MNTILDDPHVLNAVMQEFEIHKLPRILRLKKQVDDGGLLSTAEVDFLKEIYKEITQYEPFVETHAEFESLYINFVNLYRNILDTAMENEQASA